MLAAHVVGGGEHVPERRAAEDPRAIRLVGDRVREVGVAAGDEVEVERRRQARDALGHPRRHGRRGDAPGGQSGGEAVGGGLQHHGDGVGLRAGGAVRSDTRTFGEQWKRTANLHAQWGDKDFEPIAREFDRLFARRNLLNTRRGTRP